MEGTLGARLAGGGNALNAIRLLLAALVVLGHTYPISGRAEGRVWSTSQIAVNGFFVLSGFLIARSRMRLDLPAFLWHRALRILPGFWVCLLVVGFVVAPLTAHLSGETWHPVDGFDFAVRNSLVRMRDFAVGETLQQVPIPGSWNGSLWTLWFEAAAYVGAAALLSVPVVRRHLGVVLAALVLAAACALPLVNGPWPVTDVDLLQGCRLGGYFVAGMALWAWRDTIPCSPALIGLAGAVVLALFFCDPVLRDTLSPLPLGYLLLTLGGDRRITLGRRHDLSYGLYVYAWPVQQVLMALGLAQAPVPVLFGLAIALTLPLAWCSWHLVERPALRLKGRPRRRQTGPAGPLASTSPKRPSTSSSAARAEGATWSMLAKPWI